MTTKAKTDISVMERPAYDQSSRSSSVASNPFNRASSVASSRPISTYSQAESTANLVGGGPTSPPQSPGAVNPLAGVQAARRGTTPLSQLTASFRNRVSSPRSSGNTDARLEATERLTKVCEAIAIDRGRTEFSMTSIHWAVASGDVAEVSKIVSAKSKTVDETHRPMKCTPLHIAAGCGHLSVAQLLVEHGAKVFAADSGNLTPLHWAAGTGAVDVVRLLMKNGGDVSARTKQNATPLHYAANRGHEDVVRLLLTSGADIDARNQFEQTALHLAARGGHTTVAQLLLENGASLEIPDDGQATPLHYAAKEGHDSVVELLLQKGAIVDTVDDAQRTALHYAARGDQGNAAKMLVLKGANINARDGDESTPLHYTAKGGCILVSRLLIVAGCELDPLDNAQKTPLHYAADSGREINVRQLIEFPINSKTKRANIEARDGLGNTPLHMAASWCKMNVVKALLENGADINAQNTEGWTALHFAKDLWNGEAMVMLLLERGIDRSLKDAKGKTALGAVKGKAYASVVDWRAAQAAKGK